MDSRLDEHALRQLLDAGRTLVSEFELEAVLGELLRAATEITGARYAAIGVLDGSRTGLERFVHRGIDETTRARIGELPTGRGVLGVLIREPRALRLADVGSHPDSFGFPEGHPPMRTFLGVPVIVRGEPWGNLYLTEKRGGGEFDERDEDAAVILGEWAAIAIDNARSVAAERLSLAMEAAEHERMQWARELHDDTLQGLAAVRLLLAGGRRGTADLGAAVDRALEQIDAEISSMRALISDLRPDSLDQLGVEEALADLAERFEGRSDGVRIEVDAESGNGRLGHDLETAVYRVTQEALTNAVRHGSAGRITVRLDREPGRVRLTVADDGRGFEPDAVDLGFGIRGMRERAELAGGLLGIESTPGRGTSIEMVLPVDDPGGSGED